MFLIPLHNLGWISDILYLVYVPKYHWVVKYVMIFGTIFPILIIWQKSMNVKGTIREKLTDFITTFTGTEYFYYKLYKGCTEHEHKGESDKNTAKTALFFFVGDAIQLVA